MPSCTHCIRVGLTCTVLTSTLVMTASKDTLGCCVLPALAVARGARLAGGGGWLEAGAAVEPGGGGGPGRAVVTGGGSAAGACSGGGSAGGGGTNSTKTSAGTGALQCTSVPLCDTANGRPKCFDRGACFCLLAQVLSTTGSGESRHQQWTLVLQNICTHSISLSEAAAMIQGHMQTLFMSVSSPGKGGPL